MIPQPTMSFVELVRAEPPFPSETKHDGPITAEFRVRYEGLTLAEYEQLKGLTKADVKITDLRLAMTRRE